MADDRVLVITGASSGIGAATARAAAADGYSLVLAARSEDKLAELVADVGEDRAIAVATDVTDWAANERLIAAAAERFGRVDAVFANAGFGAARGWLKETPEHWRDMVLTNVLGAAYTLRAAIPEVKKTTGHLLVTGSVAGRRALPGSLYSCTKWAVTAMGEAVRADLNETGVRVTVIEPGMVDTPFFDNGAGPGALHPGDIARAVMYALSQPPHVDINEILIRPTAQTS